MIGAEVHEEAGAFTEFTIMEHLDILLPEQDEYEQYELEKNIEEAKLNGNQNRASQILLADVSIASIKFVFMQCTENSLSLICF